MILFIGLSSTGGARGDDVEDDPEIRVIRPKFQQKREKYELGANVTVIMNETFIYTYLASGLWTLHFSEAFAMELMGGYGFSQDREDKDLLQKNFDIQLMIPRTRYILLGSGHVLSGKGVYRWCR